MTGHAMHNRPWIDTASAIDISCVEVDGRDKWIAQNSSGLIAMADSRASLRSLLRRIVVRGHTASWRRPWAP
ncbi:MAG: hypothetical protein QOG52_1077 [Frankiaceae bacterium]|jgi:hypothetical protein|nr:hypothetical protein [Frankiaceae bacterium]MDQ1715871.1 hypothetical protein [Frankiaceae bacterium]MDQ1724049.1 hypothetical protein [Frankiaceae bacterium]